MFDQLKNERRFTKSLNLLKNQKYQSVSILKQNREVIFYKVSFFL